MGEITDRFVSTFRDYTISGIPGSGPHEPVKSDIRAIGLSIEAQIAIAVLANQDPAQAAAIVAPLLSSAQSAADRAEQSARIVGQIFESIPQQVAFQLSSAVAAATAQSRAARDQAQSFADDAQEEADRAEGYALALEAGSLGNWYSTIEAGAAAVANGATYFVITDAGQIIVAQKSGGVGVIKAQFSTAATVALMARLTSLRPTLYRAFDRVPLPEAGAFKPYFDVTFNGSRYVSTDASKTPLWSPNTTNSYNGVWVRDMFMAMMMAPERFTWVDISSAYDWYKARVNLPLGPLGANQQFPGGPQVDPNNRTTRNDYWVPDHIFLDGTPQYFPGEPERQIHPSTWGQRSPTDGNTWLMCGAWLVWAKTGDTSLYRGDKEFLWNLLDSVPTEAGTNLLYVDPTRRFVDWGFRDTVNICGGTSMGSVQLADAWRRLADMAAGAGDFITAQRALARADRVITGIAGLFRDMENTGVATGALLASNGPVSSAQYDVWSSALAVYFDVVDADKAAKIAGWLNSRFFAAPVPSANGKNDWFGPGGVRHVMRSNDYDPGKQVWQEGFFGGGFAPGTYDTYQYGANWFTPVAWVFEALGRSFPSTVRRLRQIIVAQFGREQQIVVAGASIFPSEWFRGETGQYAQAVRYLTSAAALLGVDARTAGGELPAMRTRLTMGASTNIPRNTYTKVGYSQIAQSVVGPIDEMGGALVSANAFRATLTGRHGIEIRGEWGKHGREDGSPWGGYRLSIYVNGAERVPGQDVYIGQDIQPGAYMFCEVDLAEGDLLTVYATTYQGAAGTNPLLLYAIPDATLNARYNFLEVTWKGA